MWLWLDSALFKVTKKWVKFLLASEQWARWGTPLDHPRGYCSWTGTWYADGVVFRACKCATSNSQSRLWMVTSVGLNPLLLIGKYSRWSWLKNDVYSCTPLRCQGSSSGHSHTKNSLNCKKHTQLRWNKKGILQARTFKYNCAKMSHQVVTF